MNRQEMMQHFDDPGMAEIELTKQEWEIVCGAVMLLSHSGRGSDLSVIRKLSERLEQYKGAKGAVICL